MIIRKSSKLYSILNNKCPQCHEGPFWMSKNPYVNLFKYGGNMHPSCAVCELQYEPEPGYWYGAMYVSYAIGVAIFVAVWIFNIVVLPEAIHVGWEIGAIVFALTFLAPVNYFLSRLVWINFFISYRKQDNDSYKTGISTSNNEK